MTSARCALRSLGRSKTLTVNISLSLSFSLSQISPAARPLGSSSGLGDRSSKLLSACGQYYCVCARSIDRLVFARESRRSSRPRCYGVGMLVLCCVGQSQFSACKNPCNAMQPASCATSSEHHNAPDYRHKYNQSPRKKQSSCVSSGTSNNSGSPPHHTAPHRRLTTRSCHASRSRLLLRSRCRTPASRCDHPRNVPAR